MAGKESDLAIKLIEALAARFEPENFEDKYREQVEALIAAKIQGWEVATGRAEQTVAAPVAGIMEALKKSLAAARKPPAIAEQSAATGRPQRVTQKRLKRNTEEKNSASVILASLGGGSSHTPGPISRIS